MYNKDEVIIKQGSTYQRIFQIASGEVRIEKEARRKVGVCQCLRWIQVEMNDILCCVCLSVCLCLSAVRVRVPS